jgi:Galactose oxidase, central domain
MTTGREGATATLLGNGRVLLAGGGNPSGLASAELYDPNSRSWSATGRMTAGPLVDPNMQGSAAALLPNGQVPDAGGYSVVCGVENCDYPPSPGAELYTP